ncbi:MAG: MFS transporter [Anaerolineales bacterium]|nr:MFS transporter [Anaerolineales bacterium]
MSANPAVSVGYGALLRNNHNYRNIWFGEIVSLFGDWFNLIASAALVAKLTGSGVAVGGLFVARMLAPFFISPLAGVWADRYDRRRLLMASDLARFVIVMGFLLVRNPGDVWLLYTLTVLQLALSGVFFPARNAILPDITAPNELGAANALSSTTWSVMLSIGAALGGLVTGEWGIYPAFVVDAVSFLISAIFIYRVTYTPPARAAHTSGARAAFEQYAEGLDFLRRNADLLMIALLKTASGLVISGGFQVLQVVITERVFVIGEGGATALGLTYAAVGIGTGIGPIAARYFTGDRVWPLRVAIAVGFVAAAAGLLIMAPLASLEWVLVGSLLRGVGAGLIWVFSTQLLLHLTPAPVRGRVFSSDFAGQTLANAVGAAVIGWALDGTRLGLTGLLAVLGVATLLAAAGWTAWIMFGVKRAPHAESAA